MLQTKDRLNVQGVRSDRATSGLGRFQQALILCHYPPAGASGAPIIVRQLFKHYDPEKLDVLCCSMEYRRALQTAKESLLPCPHTIFPNFRPFCPRPYRIFRPIMEGMNCLRLFSILRRGRRLIRERNIETIFTATSTVEINLAAYFLSREFGLPLHYFETDDWELCNSPGLPRWLIRRYRHELFRSVAGLWLTSPNMVRDFEDRFAVKGEFLFHFVDVEHYREVAISEMPPPAPAPISVVYTGAINNMFRDTMASFCEFLNEGLMIDGRPVHLTIYSHGCPPNFLGPGVSFAGYVSNNEIPQTLARAHVLLVAVSFSRNPTIQPLVKTSLYTKTVDYLASGRPVLVIAPPDSAEVDYFGKTTEVVTEWNRHSVETALRRLVTDDSHTTSLVNRGLDLVRQRHSRSALERLFLRHFRKELV